MIAAIALHAAGARADCGTLQGNYRYEGVSSDRIEATLGDLIMGPDRSKLMRIDRTGSEPASLSPARTLTRPKVTHLATHGELVLAPHATHMRFVDRSGKLLVESSLDRPESYRCEGDHLVRVMERTSGVGNDIRTERVEEVLEVNAKRELVHRESFTVIEGSGKPHQREQRFARLP